MRSNGPLDFLKENIDYPEMEDDGLGLSHEEPTEPRDIISDLQKKLSEMKECITEKLKPLFPEDKEGNIAEALDDATSALDLASHHLTDVDNSLSGGGETSTEPTEPDQPLMDETY